MAISEIIFNENNNYNCNAVEYYSEKNLINLPKVGFIEKFAINLLQKKNVYKPKNK